MASARSKLILFFFNINSSHIDNSQAALISFPTDSFLFIILRCLLFFAYFRSIRNAIILRTQLSVRVQAIIGKSKMKKRYFFARLLFLCLESRKSW